MKHLLSIHDLSKKEIETLLGKAADFKKHPRPDLLRGKILASLFFEPSTRTRLSFESAMIRLGGANIGFADGGVSSASKGESLEDAIRVISSYADAIAIRHPDKGSAALAAKHSRVPVINAGDGTGEHPTQTLLDLFTIQETQGSLEGLHIACIGDLKHSRTVHSLALVAPLFGMHLYFLSPSGLSLPGEYHGKQIPSLSTVSSNLDIIYMVRTQKERFSSPAEYEKTRGSFILKQEDLAGTKKTLKILHPLPRNEEIDTEIDSLEQACYFEQAANGLYVRQALLSLLLGGK